MSTPSWCGCVIVAIIVLGAFHLWSRGTREGGGGGRRSDRRKSNGLDELGDGGEGRPERVERVCEWRGARVHLAGKNPILAFLRCSRSTPLYQRRCSPAEWSHSRRQARQSVQQRGRGVRRRADGSERVASSHGQAGPQPRVPARRGASRSTYGGRRRASLGVEGRGQRQRASEDKVHRARRSTRETPHRTLRNGCCPLGPTHRGLMDPWTRRRHPRRYPWLWSLES